MLLFIDGKVKRSVKPLKYINHIFPHKYITPDLSFAFHLVSSGDDCGNHGKEAKGFFEGLFH